MVAFFLLTLKTCREKLSQFKYEWEGVGAPYRFAVAGGRLPYWGQFYYPYKLFIQ